jgi:hypothetical protein
MRKYVTCILQTAAVMSCDDKSTSCKYKINRLYFILSRIRVTIDAVWFGEGIYWPLITLLGTTRNYSAPANLYNSQITTSPAKPFPACCVLTSRSLSTTSNSGDSSASYAQVLSSQPPVQNSTELSTLSLAYSISAQTTQKTPFIQVFQRMSFRCLLRGRCLETDVLWEPFGSNCCFSDPTFLALNKYTTIFIMLPSKEIVLDVVPFMEWKELGIQADFMLHSMKFFEVLHKTVFPLNPSNPYTDFIGIRYRRYSVICI